MNIKLLRELFGDLYPTVTQDGGEPEGGGGGAGASASGSAGDAGAGDPDDENATIKKLRAEIKAAERRLAAVEGLDPKVYKEATGKVEQLEKELRERDALIEAERLRLEKKNSESIAAAKQEAETERQARQRLEIKTAAKAAYELAKGRSGADDDGRSFFDGFMALVGEKHLKTDEHGKLIVVDAQGDPVQSKDGKGRISPDAWMKELADNSAVVGTFFEAAMGSGSGMSSSRGGTTRGLPALKDLTPSQRSQLAWSERV
jgi:hypothetical protein